MPPRKQLKRQLPPSRRRYEVGHPVVSVRVPLELYQALEDFKRSQSMSLADVLRIGLERAKPDIEKAYLRGVEEGYEIGYGEAQEDYKVGKFAASLSP